MTHTMTCYDLRLTNTYECPLKVVILITYNRRYYSLLLTKKLLSLHGNLFYITRDLKIFM